jgi:hypothetical protein
MGRSKAPFEQTQEEIVYNDYAANEGWVLGVALTSILLAVFAAISSLIAEHQASSAMIKQIQNADRLNYYQAKRIKFNLLKTKIEILAALGKSVEEKEQKKLGEYERDQELLAQEADRFQHESEKHLHVHSIMSYSMTMFLVAFAVGAFAVLTKRRQFWFICIAFGIVGIGIFIWGLF